MQRFRLRPPLMPRLSEDDVEKGCVDILRWRHWYVARLQSGRVKSLDGKRILTLCEAGTPDYLCCHRDHPPFFLETKRTKGMCTPVQERKQWELEKVYRIPTVTIDKPEDLIAYLDKLYARDK